MKKKRSNHVLWLDRAESLITSTVVDARAFKPDELEDMYQIILKGSPPSLNQWYAGVHWSKRKAVANEWHGLFRAAFQEANLPKPIKTPITLNVTQFTKGRLKDADNVVVAAKLCGDALRLYRYIADDTPEHIPCVILQSKKGTDDKLVVLLTDGNGYANVSDL